MSHVRAFDGALEGEPEDETVIGCVYIYPIEDDANDARVSAWVRQADADLDPVLYRAVRDWLDETWPFDRVLFAVRT